MADTTIKLSGTYDSIEAYELLEEMRETADNYLPLTGGEISGDLTVDGQLSANLTGTASGNLPLSGGTMTGNIVTDSPLKTPTDDTVLGVYGGTDYNNGAALQVFGKNHATYPGYFSLRASDGVNNKILIGQPDGVFTWSGKTIPVKDVNIQTGKTASTSVNANSSTSIAITFSPAFASAPVVLATVQTTYSGFFASVGSVTTSGASIILNNTSSNTRSVPVSWMAISI